MASAKLFQDRYARLGTMLVAMLLAVLLAAPEARGQTRRVRSRQVREAIDLLERGMQREAEGEYERAISLLNDSRELMASPMALYHLGVCFARMGRLREARDYLNWALAESPDFREAQQELLSVEGLLAAAIPELPDQPPVAIDTKTETERPPPTSDELQTILFPENERLADVSAWAKSDESPVALATYDWHFRQGQLFFENKRYPRAALELVEALRLDEERMEGRLLLAEALDLSGRQDAAVRQYEEARQRFPNRPEPLFQSGEFLRHRLNDHEGAVAWYEQCIERFPDFAPAYTNLGNAWFDQGDYAKALAAYEAGVAKTPDNPKLYRNIGVIYQAHLGDKEKARQAYLKYLELGGEEQDLVKRYLQELDRLKDPDKH